MVESSGKMIDSLSERFGRIFYLVPAKYWYTVAGISIISVIGGITETVVSRPEIVPEVAETKVAYPAEEISAFIDRKEVALPAVIGDGNIFRTERKNHKPPPPTKHTAELEKPEDGDEVPQIELRGIIISGDHRMAIVDGDVKKFIKTKMNAGDWDVSGAKFLKLKTKGLDYRITKVGTEKLVGETFYEGSVISGYLLEHIFEDGIELINLENGKRLTFFLDAGKHEQSMKKKLAGKSTVKTRKDGTALHISGASR